TVCLYMLYYCYFFFFSSRRRHTRSKRDWSSDVCSSDLTPGALAALKKSGQQPGEFLTRHVNRELSDEDRKENDYSVENGFRLLRSEERRVGKECRSRWGRDQ